ncbi:MAG: DUF2158 domain-containing protein [Candidatus Nanopelagicales bacterium]
MALKLNLGDVVKLKSGGPWMTVTRDRTEHGNKLIQVSWFDGSELVSTFLAKEVLDLNPAAIKQDE